MRGQRCELRGVRCEVRSVRCEVRGERCEDKTQSSNSPSGQHGPALCRRGPGAGAGTPGY